MSVNVKIRTEKTIDLKEALITLASEKGYRIKANSLDEDFAQFYISNTSTRPIDISKEEDGYEVRLTVLASREDYAFFRDVINVVLQHSAGVAFMEDDDDMQIENVYGFLNDNWIEEQMMSDFRLIRTMVYHPFEDKEFSEIELFGPVCKFCVGINLFKMLGVTKDTDAKLGHEFLTKQFRYSQYSRPDDIRRTSTRLVLKGKDGEKERNLTVYSPNEYDMIAHAELIALMNGEDDVVVLEYNDFMKIVPQSWELFDDKQYFTTELSEDEWKELYGNAQKYRLM